MSAPVLSVETHLDWPYDEALAHMARVRDEVIAGGAMRVLVGSHREHVVTLGRHASEAQLLARAELEARGVLIRRVERGGGATAHGPGQLVVYPVVHLERCGLDVSGLTCALLRAAAAVAASVGVQTRIGEPAGLYTDSGKVASVGFRVERGVVTHGLALNVDNDLTAFGLIAPCGIASQRMASLASMTSGPRAAEDRSSLSVLAEQLGFHVAQQCMVPSQPSHPPWSIGGDDHTSDSAPGCSAPGCADRVGTGSSGRAAFRGR